jgi:RND family efflux transporter MFP subunit
VREDAAARIEAARAQLSIAEKSLDQARTRLSYTRLTAPFDGVVASRLADPGDLAASGRPLVKIVRQSKVKIRAAVSPEDFLLLRIGQPADLTLGNTRLRAAVSRVFPALGEDRLAMVEIDIDTPPAGFVSGAAVGVDLNLSSAEGLLVPTDALLESEKGSFVFTVTDSVVRTVPVQVLGRSLEQVAVSGSLAEGDEVIVARPSRLMTLADGVPVVVQKGAVQ